MTLPINSASRILQYTATSGQTSFAIPFEFYSNDEITVYNNGTQLTYSAAPSDETEFSVTGAEVESGGNITIGGTGATLNDIITIVSEVPIRRLTDFPISGPFQIDQLNEELDLITIMLQQHETLIKQRMLLMADFDSPTDMNNLPLKAARANKVLGFDADGQPTVADGTLSGLLPDLGAVTVINNTLIYWDVNGDLQQLAIDDFTINLLEDIGIAGDPGEDSLILWDHSAQQFVWTTAADLINTLANPTIRTFAGTTDTLVLADAGNIVHSTGASAAVVTVPPDVFTEGDVIELKQAGTGAVTVAGGSGVTIESFGNVVQLAGQNSVAVLRYEGSNVWQLGGELLTVASDLEDLTYATGDIIYYDGANLTNLGVGTDDQVLTLASGVPSWADATGGGGVSTVRTVTGTTDTLVIGDQGNIVETTNASAVTITVPPNSSVAFEVGSFVEVHQDAAGLITIAPGSGVTIRSRDSILDSAGEDAVLVLRKVGTDEWVLSGDLAQAAQDTPLFTRAALDAGNTSAANAAAIQDLVDAGTVLIEMPAGTFDIDPVSLASNVHLKGAGIRRTILKLPTQTITDDLDFGGVINAYGGSGTELTGIVLEDFTVDGNKAGLTLAGSTVAVNIECIDFRFVDYSYINRVRTINSRSDGIDLDDCDYCNITDCEGEDCDGYAVHLSTNTSYCSVSDCIAESCGTTNTRGGFDSYLTTTGNKFSNCVANDCYRGFYIRGTEHMLTNCDADTPAQQGFLLEGNNIICSSCRADGSTSNDGWQISGDNNQLVGCQGNSNASQGIEILSGAEYNALSAFYAAANTGSNIYIVGNNNIVTGSVAKNGSSFGIRIEGNTNIATSCRSTGNTSANLSDIGTGNTTANNITS